MDKNDGNGWQTLVTGVTGTFVSGATYKYAWSNGWDYGNTGMKIRVSAVTDASGTGLVTDESNVFEIRPSITVDKPGVNEQVLRGRDYVYRWTASGNVGNVNVDLSINSGSTYPIP